jgi:hypothetical protein
MAPLMTRAYAKDGPTAKQAIADPSSLRRLMDVELIGTFGISMPARAA